MLPSFFMNWHQNNPYLISQLQLLLQYQYLMANHKEMRDQACQISDTQEDQIQTAILSNSNHEQHLATEIGLLLVYLSKNISLLTEANFNIFVSQNLKLLSNLSTGNDLPQILKNRYFQVNKTKEELTKFIIRRCFDFIKQQLDYQENENLPAEGRDRAFYEDFFSQDQQFMLHLASLNLTIDNIIPFRKDSSIKTMNNDYLSRLFKSERFTQYYVQFLDQLRDICEKENDEKLDKMVKSVVKIIYTRKFEKLKTYRRFPLKAHEINDCLKRARHILRQYQTDKSKYYREQDTIKRLNKI